MNDLRKIVATAIYADGERPEWITTWDGSANSTSYDLADRALEALFPTYFTVTEVATRMRVSKMTIYRMIDAGTLPGIKFGQSFRIRGRDLLAYLEQNTTG